MKKKKCNELGGLKEEIFIVSVLGVTDTKSRCHQGHVHPETSATLYLFLDLAAVADIPWLVAASLQPYPSIITS